MKALGNLLLALRSLFFVVLLPGTATVFVPRWILAERGQGLPAAWGAREALALVPIALGAAILLRCVWDFARQGRGTLAPIDPPRELVVGGLYRYVRNPMYVGVVTVLLGEAALFRSRALLVYAGLFWAATHLFIVLYEEQTLAARFGDSYARYRSAVRRWLPGRPYDGGDRRSEGS
jgi:protein-S-isoprenylcysteine O-methyltransferase Ste14